MEPKDVLVHSEWKPNAKKAFEHFKNNRWFVETQTPDRQFIEPLRRSWRLETQRTPQFEGASNVFVPIVRWLTEAVLVRLFTAQFNQTPFTLLRAINTDRIAEVSKLEDLLFHTHTVVDLPTAFYSIILDAVLLGTGVGYKEIVKGFPYTRYVPLENFIVYPDTGRWDAVEWVGHTELRSYKKLKEEYPDLKYEDIFKSYPAPKDLAQDPELIPFRGGIPTRTLYFWWDGTWWKAVYLPIRGLFLEFTEYPLPVPPYFLYSLNARYSLFGEGVGRLLTGLEMEINELHNLHLDNLLLTNLPIFKVRKGSSASLVQSLKAGMKIPVETPSDIDILYMPQMYQGLMSEERQLRELAQQVSGVSEIMAGQVPQYATAYAVEAGLLEGSVRFKQYLKALNEALSYSSKLDLLLLKIYGDPLYQTRVVGGVSPLLKFSLDEILEETEFRLEGNTTTTNREADRQRWMAVREMLYPNLGLRGRWLIDATILRLLGVQKPEAFLGEEPTPEQEEAFRLAQQQQMMMMMAQQQMAGGATPPDEVVAQ